VDRLAGEIAIGDDDEVAIPPHVVEAVEVSWGRFHKHFTCMKGKRGVAIYIIITLNIGRRIEY
jgi:ribosome biogenesis protein Tsr3